MSIKRVFQNPFLKNLLAKYYLHDLTMYKYEKRTPAMQEDVTYTVTMFQNLLFYAMNVILEDSVMSWQLELLNHWCLLYGIVKGMGH